MSRLEDVRSTFLVPTVALLGLVGAATAVAEPRVHDDGWFGRAALGGGPAATASGGYDFSGTGLDINLAAGKIIYPNLAVHANIFGWVINDPDVEFTGLQGTANTELGLIGAGAGITYFFGSSNVYVSPSIGLAQVTASGADLEGESGSGLGLTVQLGKEFWVSDRWGVGLAGAFGYHNVPDGPYGAFSGWNSALQLSVTFN